MNVTVIIPQPLQAACEGRARIELGLPSTANVADALQTLMALYPGLVAFVANEKRSHTQHFAVAQVGLKIFLFTSTGGLSARERRRLRQ